MPLVSIIMPSLNVGKYIEKCIQSVMCQTLSDIEILVIDAGSTDGTLDIIENLATTDDRIKVIHSDVKSYGYQVNLGIQLSSGEYVGIVETDDYIEPDMYEVLYKLTEENDVDYVKGQGCFEEWLFGEDYTQRPIIDYNNITPERVIAPCNHSELQYNDYYLWLGLYKKSFIQKIRLNETPGAAFQDVGFAIQCHSLAKAALYTDKLVYHYRFGTEGTSSASHRGINYVLQEYKYNKAYVESLDHYFASAYYKKMFMQIRARYYRMGYGDNFWVDTMPENVELQEILSYLLSEGKIEKKQFSEDEWVHLMLFIESPYALYGAIATYIRVVKEKIEKISSKIKRQRGCVLVGTGLKSRYPYALVQRSIKGEILAVCDNSKDKQGINFYEHQIISVEDAVNSYSDAYYIVTSRKYGEEIKQQLTLLGISEENLYIFNLVEDMNFLI